MMDAWERQLHGGSLPVQHEISTPRAIVEGEAPDKKARTSSESAKAAGASTSSGAGIIGISTSSGAGPVERTIHSPFPFHSVPKGSRPNTPRRLPSPTTTVVARKHKLPSKSRSQSLEVDKRADSSKRKIAELTKRNKELEIQLKDQVLIAPSDTATQNTPDSRGQSGSSVQDLRELYETKVAELLSEQDTLREQISFFLEVQKAQETQVRSGQAEINKIRAEKQQVMSEAKQKDETYRLMVDSLDRKYRDSQNSAQVNKAQYERNIANTQDLDTQLRRTVEYVEQLHYTFAQYEQFYPDMQKENGGLKNELEMSRAAYSEHHSHWEQWYEAKISDITAQLVSMQNERDTAQRGSQELLNSNQSIRRELADCKEKMEEMARLTLVNQTHISSLETQLKLKQESGASPGADPDDEDEKIDLQVVRDLETRYRERIKGYKATQKETENVVSRLNRTLADKDNLIDSLKSELQSANVDGGSDRENCGVCAGETPRRRMRSRSPPSPPKERKTKTQVVEEIFRRAEGSSSDTSESSSEDSFVTGDGGPKAASDVGTTSVAPLSQVGTEGSDKSFKVPGKKAATAVTIPPFPTYNHLTEWIASIGRNLWIVSQYTDQAEIPWLKEVNTKTFDELAEPGENRFRYLDALLIPGLEKKLPTDLAREYKEKNKELDKQNKTIGGRQLVKMVIEYYKSTHVMNIMYSYQNIYELKWFGDERIQDFMTEWNRIVDNLDVPLKKNPDWRDLLYQKMVAGGTKIFALDLVHFKRQKAISDKKKEIQEDYSFEFLWGIMEAHLAEIKEEKVIQARRLSVKNVGGRRDRNRNEPAAPAPEQPKPKAKGKPKEKEKRARSEGKGSGKKNKEKDKKGGGKGTSTPRGNSQPRGEGGEFADRCWFFQAKFYGAHKEGCKYTAESCSKVHGNPIGEENFKKMTRPGDRSRSASRGRGKGGEKQHKPSDLPPHTFEGTGGWIIPICCHSFRVSGSCKFEKDNPGKQCPNHDRHWTQKRYEQERAKLNPGRKPPTPKDKPA